MIIILLLKVICIFLFISYIYTCGYVNGFYRNNEHLNESIYEQKVKHDCLPPEFVNDIAFANDEHLRNSANIEWEKEDEN